MHFLGKEIAPLGMGCWPIGGAMFAGGQSVGYTNIDDAESTRTIHAALAAGITLFDTAAAYGAGHAERLLAGALKDRPDALVVTKIGLAINEKTKQLTGDETDPAQVLPAIDACLSRLGRDHIDLLFLHLNALPIAQAEPLFDAMESARAAGKIRAYGWSTDFCDRVVAMADRPGFVAVEHATNVLADTPRIRNVIRENQLTALIRSPLAMGLLGGKYGAEARVPANDIRASGRSDYFKDAQADPVFLAKLDAVRALLTSGGRSLVQGALGWLWAKGDMIIPIPGARNVEQIEGIAGALAFGALPDHVMAQIETLIEREPEDTPDRAR
ncbi:MAG: aldo/keto reductase [Rhodobacteraceae bacterium]|nr:aldo/keto reductase [Paracoccaceae bacterium]